MTEKEAIIRFDFIRCALLGGTKPHIMPNEENIGLVDAAIKALEEVQQYRKHGVTVESALNNMCDLTAAENLIEEYRAIGTPEECLRNKDFLDFLSDKMNPNDFETYLRLYNALEEKGCEE